MNADLKVKKKLRRGNGWAWLLIGIGVVLAACVLLAPAYCGFVEYVNGGWRMRVVVERRAVIVLYAYDDARTVVGGQNVMQNGWSGKWASPPTADDFYDAIQAWRSYMDSKSNWSFRFSMWATPVGLGVMGGLMLLWPVVRARVLWRGRCASCGYDRKGLGAGAVCPECGKEGELKAMG